MQRVNSETARLSVVSSLPKVAARAPSVRAATTPLTSRGMSRTPRWMKMYRSPAAVPSTTLPLLRSDSSKLSTTVFLAPHVCRGGESSIKVTQVKS